MEASSRSNGFVSGSTGLANRRAAAFERNATGVGVCHTCETGLRSGAVAYSPDPVEAPADGNALVCCSQPAGDVALDM
jgi:ferredoxin